MKNQLAAIELRVLVGEFQQLAGSRLEQVYDLAESPVAAKGKSLALQFGISEGKAFLVCLAPSAIFLSTARPATSESPGGFCSILRHHLGNSRVVSISQPGSERILELGFSSGLKLVIELFSKGNVLLVNGEGIIVGVAEHHVWKDRTVRPGFRYLPPPLTADFLAVAIEEFSGILLSSEKDSVVKALAVDVGLSGAYAEEACVLASVGKDKGPKRLSRQEMSGLFSSLQQLLSRKPQPVVLLDGKGEAVGVFPFPLASAAAAMTRSCITFSEAVGAVILKQIETASSSSATAAYDRRIRELEIAAMQQEEAIGGFVRASGEAAAPTKSI